MPGSIPGGRRSLFWSIFGHVGGHFYGSGDVWGVVGGCFGRGWGGGSGGSKKRRKSSFSKLSGSIFPASGASKLEVWAWSRTKKSKNLICCILGVGGMGEALYYK